MAPWHSSPAPPAASARPWPALLPGAGWQPCPGGPARQEIENWACAQQPDPGATAFMAPMLPRSTAS